MKCIRDGERISRGKFLMIVNRKSNTNLFCKNTGDKTIEQLWERETESQLRSQPEEAKLSCQARRKKIDQAEMNQNVSKAISWDFSIWC